MERSWDDTLKNLIRQHPQAFINWFVKEADFVKAIPGEFAKVILNVDGLLEIIQDGASMLLHVEFQTYPDAEMAERLLKYNVVASIQHKLPLYSCVIYLLGEGTVPASPLVWRLPSGMEILHFQFMSIQLGRMTPQQILQLEQPGLLPLLPLTKGGTDRTVVERMFAEIGPEQTDLAAIGMTLATYVFMKGSPADLEWLLKRYQQMHDIIRESPFIQWVLKEGREEGQLEGLAKGQIEGKRIIARDLLLEFVQKRFPDLLTLAQETATRVEQPEQLEALVLKIGLAQSQSEAEGHLRQS